jgi:hypothetical protein
MPRDADSLNHIDLIRHQAIIRRARHTTPFTLGKDDPQ